MLSKTKPTLNQKALAVALDTGDNQLVYYYQGKFGTNSIDSVGEFEPFVWGDAVTYVCGKRGSGKSTWCSMYIKNYVSATDNKVFFFSRFEDDPSITLPARSMRIPLDQLEEIELDDLRDSLVVFDDITNSTLSKKQMTFLHNFLLDLIENSRHMNINILMTSHLCSSYGKTRSILNESSALCIFPQYSNRYFIEACLKTYYGLSKPQIEHVLENQSRWVEVNTINPKFILDQHKIEIYS